MRTMPEIVVSFAHALRKNRNIFTLRPVVLKEQLHDIDVFGAGERVPTNADYERLAEANASRLRDGLIMVSS